MHIDLKEIVKRFGALEAVSRVSLEVRDGELFTLLGPSGCGKTTILRLIGGFHKPDHGEILFQDQRIDGLAPHDIAALGLEEVAAHHMEVSKATSAGLPGDVRGDGDGIAVDHAVVAVERRDTQPDPIAAPDAAGGLDQRIRGLRLL